jgi:hypothetical protein
LGPRESRWRNAVLARLVTLLAVTLVAPLPDARARGADLNGLVSIAEGESFTIIRGDELRRGVQGIALVAGDLVETGPDAFLVVELQGGSPEDPWASLIGIGPSSGVYFLPRASVATLVVLKGWLKIDIRSAGKPRAVSVLGPRLGVQSQQAVVLLHTDEHSDALFDEQGSGTLLLRDAAATHTDKETRPNQFFVREGRAAVVLQSHPTTDFLAKMPVAFRDTLPENSLAGVKRPLEPVPAGDSLAGRSVGRPLGQPQRIRKVSYLDIQPWLTLPRDWRTGFIARFRGRLQDPAFFAAMDAHLALHPEWLPILHPKPGSEHP